MQGQGHLVWHNGKEYKGEFFQDKRHGYGEFFWKDGRYYKGGWEDGKQHGEGEFRQKDGILLKGLWEHGQRIKWEESQYSAIEGANHNNDVEDEE